MYRARHDKTLGLQLVRQGQGPVFVILQQQTKGEEGEGNEWGWDAIKLVNFSFYIMSTSDDCQGLDKLKQTKEHRCCLTRVLTR